MARDHRSDPSPELDNQLDEWNRKMDRKYGAGWIGNPWQTNEPISLTQTALIVIVGILTVVAVTVLL